jgi:plasmid maintenance system antidote protein VapI
MADRAPYRWPRQLKLKFAIIEDGRSVREIAKAADLSAVTVTGACTGRTRLTPEVLTRLALALDRDPADLVVDVEVSA